MSNSSTLSLQKPRPERSGFGMPGSLADLRRKRRCIQRAIRALEQFQSMDKQVRSASAAGSKVIELPLPGFLENIIKTRALS